MRDTPGATDLELSRKLAGVSGWAPVVTSWLDGVPLAPDGVPVLRGRMTANASSRVPDRITLTVPEWDAGMSWVPGDDPAHPLAEYGQMLVVSIRVVSPVRGEWVTRLGSFFVASTDHDDIAHTVTVTAFGVLQRAAEWEFTTPEAPRTAGTFESEFRRLTPPGLSVSVSTDLVDRACPQSLQWQADRLGAMCEIVDTWPARMLTDQYGTIQLLPELPDVPTPVLTFTDGVGGTLVSAPRGATRTGRPNRVIATGSATDATSLDPVVGVWDVTAGPARVTEDGSGYGPVTHRMSSPLLETSAQAQAAARTTLARLSRPTKVRNITCAPDPRIELDDAVAVVRDGTADWGFVVGYDLPLTIHDGAMRVDVGVTA